MNKYIRIDKNNKVIGIRRGKSITDGEIESKDGEIGDIMQPDKSFITPEKVIAEPQPTQLDRIESKLDSLLAVKTQ
jgi:hypothetical protein